MEHNHIWRAYDIRGSATEEVTPQFTQKLGWALSALFQQRGIEDVVVARDARNSSPELRDALMKGLIEGGMEVSDIGAAPTPALYFAVDAMGYDAGIMITASHNPGKDNGFKFRFHNSPFLSEDLAALKAIFADVTKPSGQMGGQYALNIQNLYLQAIVEDMRSVVTPMRIVIDGGNGIAGPWLEALLNEFGCTCIPLYCTPDGNFPNHSPDPTQKSNMSELIAKVQEENAACGFGLDGDGDRLAVVSPKGELVFGDRLLALFAQDLLKWKRGSIVHDLKCSMLLREIVVANGGTTILSATGYPRIQKAIANNASLMGGEQSSHICFADRWFGFDDALYAAARILPSIPMLDERLSKFPQYPCTPELRIPVSEEKKWSVIRQIKPMLSNYTINETDGIHCSTKEGWALLRPSNTESCLSVRIEAKTNSMLQNMAKEFHKNLCKVGVNAELLTPYT
jgi:phosphomannomutase/phosphoglucomutase